MAEHMVTTELESTAQVETTSEEVRWRMDQVVRLTASSGRTTYETAQDFCKALRHLSGEVAQASDS
ncbi:hypothetical protein [Marinobacter sp. KMM 10035]|uniref:hypothetical protein n=1 Tax=Marinobacter sp. KMM 10035 TaxID=3134034 RepID=UPI00397E0606